MDNIVDIMAHVNDACTALREGFVFDSYVWQIILRPPFNTLSVRYTLSYQKLIMLGNVEYT